MQTIEETTIDKSAWPRGPWDKEPDKKQWLDEATGLPCLIVRTPHAGHLCGYVGVSTGHPAFEKHYDDIAVEVHGGLTYGAHCAGLICHLMEPCDDDHVWWLGFDCAHSGDFSPKYWSNLARTFLGDTPDASFESYKDFGYVTSEVQSLAKQLKAMA